jgi:CRISPR-associated protein Csd1
MILQALVRCYESLAAAGKLEKPGWSMVKVSWGLELTPEGQIQRLWPLEIADAKGKKRPQMIKLPAQTKKTVGVASNFLCENSSYILGHDNKGKPERSLECFKACAARHREILTEVDHPMAKAILRFFAGWNPQTAEENAVLAPEWEEILKGGNLVFCMEGVYAQDVPEIAQAWDEAYADDEKAEMGRCLVTGQKAPVAILHPSIKGIVGAQSSGAALVSFNAPSLESFGKDDRDKQGQGRNAPVSTYAAFAYTEALNYLLREPAYHSRLGDTTLIYWAEGAEEEYSSAMAGMMFSDNMEQEDLKDVMEALSSGKTVLWNKLPLNPDNRFYILGIAPNAARLAVRFFLQDTFGRFAANLDRHQKRLEIVRPAFDEREGLSVWSLLRETANPNSRDKKPPEPLVSALMRAVLMNTPYPAELFIQTEIRLRAEHEVSRGKAAILKAYLLRNVVELNPGNHPYKEVLQVQLNETTTYLPYRLGRLFAVLEALQLKANPGINATIKDRYFNSACATPAVVFPALIRLAQNHLNKLDGGVKVYYDKMITGLFNTMDESYPVRLSLQDQGIFQIGYYHQKQKFFTKKEEQENV